MIPRFDCGPGGFVDSSVEVGDAEHTVDRRRHLGRDRAEALFAVLACEHERERAEPAGVAAILAKVALCDGAPPALFSTSSAQCEDLQAIISVHGSEGSVGCLVAQ